MGFFSHLVSVVKRVVKHPISSIKKIIHNPAKKILNKNLRNSKGYKKIGKPIVKIGVAVAVGAATGGVGIAASGLTFAGLSTAGAIAGGLSAAVNGGLSSKAFKPLKDIVIPGAAGLVIGNIARSGIGSKIGQGVSKVKQVAIKAGKAEAARIIAKVKGKTSRASIAKAVGSGVGNAFNHAGTAEQLSGVGGMQGVPVVQTVQQQAAQQQGQKSPAIKLALAAAAIEIAVHALS